MIVVVGVALPFGLFFGGLWHIFSPTLIEMDGGPHWLLFAAHSRLTGLVMALAGAFLFLIVMHLARLLGRMQGKIAESLLVRL